MNNEQIKLSAEALGAELYLLNIHVLPGHLAGFWRRPEDQEHQRVFNILFLSLHLIR